MAGRTKFTHEELDEYFSRICLPCDKRIFSVTTLSDDEKITYLNLVEKHQLAKIPWENLVQHYSWHAVVNVKPKHLFRKIVRQPGRGGYCMEVNLFFHTILLSLGFDVYLTGARVYSPDSQTYGGWTHLVNLVTIAGTKYLLDGGFGGPGPCRPVALEHGKEQFQISPAQMRVEHRSISQYLTDQKVWIYESRIDETATWVPCYCFSELEFTPTDVESMNFAPWLNRHSFFTHKIVAVRFTTDRETDGPDGPGSPSEDALEGEIDGAILLNQNVLKWRRHGKKEVEWHFKSEEARVRALEMYFGIVLSEEDKEGIAGTAAALGHGRALEEQD